MYVYVYVYVYVCVCVCVCVCTYGHVDGHPAWHANASTWTYVRSWPSLCGFLQWLATKSADSPAPSIDALFALVQKQLPQDGDETCLTHGDFRIDNLIFHPTEPRVLAVLDWELSTLGHPVRLSCFWPLSVLVQRLLTHRLPLFVCLLIC